MSITGFPLEALKSSFPSPISLLQSLFSQIGASVQVALETIASQELAQAYLRVLDYFIHSFQSSFGRTKLTPHIKAIFP